MVKLQLKSGETINVVGETVINVKMNVYEITLPIRHSVSKEDLKEVKLWIDGEPAISAKVKDIKGYNQNTYVTLLVLL